MTPAKANILNAIILVTLGLWAYFGSASPSATALIPAIFGLIFLAFAKPFLAGNKVIIHIVVFLTLLIVLALAMPLKAAIGRSDTLAIVRVGVMLLSSLGALVIYIKSFVDARKARTRSS